MKIKTVAKRKEKKERTTLEVISFLLQSFLGEGLY